MFCYISNNLATGLPRYCRLVYIEVCSLKPMGRGHVYGTLRLLQPSHTALLTGYLLRLNDDCDGDDDDQAIVTVTIIFAFY